MTQFPSSDDDRNPVEVLADEFAARLRSGDSPSMAEYVARYPDHASEIEELFPGIALLEQLSEKQESEATFAQRPPQDSLPRGHRFGDIEIVREIGRGGMGVVYEAYQHSLNRSVAIKAISGSAGHSPNQAARFEREAQAAAQLHHTNIVPVFGVGEQDGISYYVMQLIDGVGLDEVLTELARKARHRIDRTGATTEPIDSCSARQLASVLVSGQLSESTIRAAGGASTRPIVDVDATAPMRHSPGDQSAHAQTVLEHRAENRTEDRTGEMGGEETPRTFVRSSLELRDDVPSSAGVRSSMVLRDEIPADETFEPSVGMEESNDHVKVDPALASLGSRYWRNIARIGLQVASGLQYAHSQGTLHRDIKPANILLDAEGTAWIADFGLAKVLEQEDVTKTGDVVGTLRYMAPEQFRGESDGRSDLYSLGLTLYELLTLRPAYEDADRQKLIAKKLTAHDPPHPRKLHPGIPRDLETIVLTCLAWEPDGRYRTAGGVVTDLQAFLDDRPIMARRISPAERFWRWCRRNPAIAGLSTAVLLLLMTVASLASIGYVKAQDKAERMAALSEEAREGREAAERSAKAAAANAAKAEEAQAKTEQIADLQWDALNRIYETFVPDRFAGPVEASVDSDDETAALATENTATVISPQTAAMLEEMLTSFDKIAAIRGTDARYLEETARAYRKVGDLHLRLGQYDEAIDAFDRASLRYRDLQQLQGPAVETTVLMARLNNGLGIAQQHLGNPGEAQDALSQSLALLMSSDVDRSDPTVRAETAATHYLMGRRPPPGSPPPRNDDRPPPDRGADSFRGSTRPDGDGSQPPRMRPGDGPGRAGAPEGRRGSGRDRDRSRGQRGRNDWRRRAGEFHENREHLETAVAILDPLIAEHSGVPEYRFLSALCHIELSHSWMQPEGVSGDDMLAAAIQILDQLVAEHPEEPDYLYQLSEAHEQRYYRWKPGFAPLSLKKYYGESSRFEWSDSLILATVPALIPYNLLIQQNHEDIDPSEWVGIDAAEQDLQTAVRLSSILLRQQPNVPRYAESHLSLLFNLTDVKVVRGDLKAAQKLIEDDALLRQSIRDRFPEASDGRGMPGIFSELLHAQIDLQREKPTDAVQRLQKLIEKSQQPVTGEDHGRRSESFRNMIQRLAYSMLAASFEAEGDVNAADEARYRASLLQSEPRDRSSGPPRGGASN